MPWLELAAVQGRRLLPLLVAALLLGGLPARALAAPGEGAAGVSDVASGRRLTLTLLGLSASASAGAVTAWVLRENYARRWNSDRCLRPGLSRGEVCGDLLASGRNAESLALVTGGGAALLLGAALTSWLLERTPPAREATTAMRCSLGVAGATCLGSF